MAPETEPLIRLDPDGVAPIIRYDLPAESSFTAAAVLPLNLPAAIFAGEYQETAPKEIFASQLGQIRATRAQPSTFSDITPKNLRNLWGLIGNNSVTMTAQAIPINTPSAQTNRNTSEETLIPVPEEAKNEAIAMSLLLDSIAWDLSVAQIYIANLRKGQIGVASGAVLTEEQYNETSTTLNSLHSKIDKEISELKALTQNSEHIHENFLIALRHNADSIQKIFKESYSRTSDRYIRAKDSTVVMSAILLTLTKPGAVVSAENYPKTVVVSSDFLGDPIGVTIQLSKEPDPTFFLIEKYRIMSVLGDYGAGNVISTINLAPGEERTISVRSYRDIESKRTAAENVLDSISTESATELETEIGRENTSSSSETASLVAAKEEGAEVSASFAPVGGPFSASASASTSSSDTRSSSSARAEAAKTFSNALDKHVAKSSAARDVTTNTTTEEAVKEGTESSIVRRITNPNFSPLNLVMRQMQQEYITVTYLEDVVIAFSTGDPDTIKRATISEIDGFLRDILKGDDETIAEVKMTILSQLLSVRDLNGDQQQFIRPIRDDVYDPALNEKGELELDDEGKPAVAYTVQGWQKNHGLRQKLSDFDPSMQDFATVPGVILDIKRRILRTDGVILDAVLGHGDALDSFNQGMQTEAVRAAKLANDLDEARLLIAMDKELSPAERERRLNALLDPDQVAAGAMIDITPATLTQISDATNTTGPANAAGELADDDGEN